MKHGGSGLQADGLQVYQVEVSTGQLPSSKTAAPLLSVEMRGFGVWKEM